VKAVEGFFAGEDFEPSDAAAPGEGLFDRGVKNKAGGLPDVAAGAVALDDW
jgi:hypothetical protein